MKVDYLFSKNNQIGSRLISWASSKEKLNLEQIPSHMAVLLDDTFVIESTLFTGVRMIPYSKWLEKNKQVYKIPCVSAYRRSKNTLESLMHLWGKKYDWFGILYFFYAFIMLVIFNKELPENNPWQDKNKYFCTEFAAILTGEDFSMSTPAKICNDWLENDE